MSLSTNIAVEREVYEKLQVVCRECGMSLTKATSLAVRDWLRNVAPSLKQALSDEKRKKKRNNED